MTLDNMTGITKGSHTAGDTFCKSQLITCNRVKECNGVCPFEDALQHADKMQTMNEQQIINHDREWIIGCIEHDGFIHTDRFDKANQIILDALSAEATRMNKGKDAKVVVIDSSAEAEQGWIPTKERLPNKDGYYLVCMGWNYRNMDVLMWADGWNCVRNINGKVDRTSEIDGEDIVAWMYLPESYKGGDAE